jgi:hypothetical protein
MVYSYSFGFINRKGKYKIKVSDFFNKNFGKKQ